MRGVSLEVENVSVSYGSVRVLEGLSLGIEPGEFVALLGSSGCGKTTLLRAISGFLQVETGSIRIAGRDITRLPPEKREMAMVFQSYALWPHMTAAQNIGYGLKLRRVSRSEQARRVDEVLALLGLGGFGDRNVTQLSGGQRQRVALGRALAINPQVLLLDEPLSNLDARIRQTVRHEIKALQVQLGITAVHVTHDREEAMVMADRIVILDAGRIAQLGTPEEVYNRPVSPFVASFMGANNVFALRVERGDGHVRIAASEMNAAAHLSISESVAQPGVNIAGIGTEGAAAAHFRGEAAILVTGAAVPADHLAIRGRVTQSSYPGGFYRYTVDVAGQTFMVDHPERLAPEQEVYICLPASALHLYPQSTERSNATIVFPDRSDTGQRLERRKIA